MSNERDEQRAYSTDGGRTALGVVSRPDAISKRIVVDRDGLKVVRLTVATGAEVPEHHSNVDVVVVVVRGAGTFTVDGVTRAIAPGDVVEMAPRVRHSLRADLELELVVTHARLGTSAHAAPPACGT